MISKIFPNIEEPLKTLNVILLGHFTQTAGHTDQTTAQDEI